MEPTDSLELSCHCFGTAAVVEVAGIVVAAEGLHIAGSATGTESVERRTVGSVAADCRFVGLGKLGSLGERQLQRTVWRGGCMLLATPAAVVVE